MSNIPRITDIIEDSDIEGDDNDYLDEIILYNQSTPTAIKLPSRPIEITPIELRNKTTCCNTRVVIGSLTIYLPVFICVSIFLTIISIGSIIVYQEFNDESCFHRLEKIKISYMEWLYIYGLTNILIISFIGWLSIISEVFDLNLKSVRLNILRISFLFHFCWYILGIVLYFYEVNRTCNYKNISYDFGMVVFVCQTIIWIIIFCHQGSNEN